MTSPRTPEEPNWRRSSRCNNGNCVEVAALPDRVLVRSSADGTTLSFSKEAWVSFLDDLRRGRFDE